MQTYYFQIHIDELRLEDEGRASEIVEDVIGEAMPDDTGDHGIHLAFFDQARSSGDPGEKLAATIGDSLEEALGYRPEVTGWADIIRDWP